jgi:methylglyoxal synthase
MKTKKNMRIGLVAHDERKKDLLEWVKFNSLSLANHQLICTGTTGSLIEKEIKSLRKKVIKLKSGPLGGDQEMGAKITADEIDILIFFWDPMSSQPHDPDVKALLRMTVIYNIPTACNRASADHIISSPLFKDKEYTRIIKDYTPYINRDY